MTEESKTQGYLAKKRNRSSRDIPPHQQPAETSSTIEENSPETANTSPATEEETETNTQETPTENTPPTEPPLVQQSREEKKKPARKQPTVYKPHTPGFDYQSSLKKLNNIDINNKKPYSGIYLPEDVADNLTKIINETEAILAKKGRAKIVRSKSFLLQYLITAGLQQFSNAEELAKAADKWSIECHLNGQDDW